MVTLIINCEGDGCRLGLDVLWHMSAHLLICVNRCILRAPAGERKVGIIGYDLLGLRLAATQTLPQQFGANNAYAKPKACIFKVKTGITI
jgi:hypothetical protein